MPGHSHPAQVAVFPSELGWMALAADGQVVLAVTCAHRTPVAAMAALEAKCLPSASDAPRGSGKRFVPRLVEKLQQFAAGQRVDFRGVRVCLDGETTFARRVIEECQRIPFGRTLTYGELAARAGRPRAARAVGNIMSRCPAPIIIPCHRVVAGSKASRSAPSAGELMRLKLRLLESKATPRE